MVGTEVADDEERRSMCSTEGTRADELLNIEVRGFCVTTPFS